MECKGDITACEGDNIASKGDALTKCTDQCPPFGAAAAAGPAPAPSPGDANATIDTTDSDSGTTSGPTTMMGSCKPPDMDANIAFVGDCSIAGDTCSKPVAANTWCCCPLDGAITFGNNVNSGFQSFGADP